MISLFVSWEMYFVQLETLHEQRKTSPVQIKVQMTGPATAAMISPFCHQKQKGSCESTDGPIGIYRLPPKQSSLKNISWKPFNDAITNKKCCTNPCLWLLLHIPRESMLFIGVPHSEEIRFEGLKSCFSPFLSKARQSTFKRRCARLRKWTGLESKRIEKRCFPGSVSRTGSKGHCASRQTGAWSWRWSWRMIARRNPWRSGSMIKTCECPSGEQHSRRNSFTRTVLNGHLNPLLQPNQITVSPICHYYQVPALSK